MTLVQQRQADTELLTQNRENRWLKLEGEVGGGHTFSARTDLEA